MNPVTGLSLGRIAIGAAALASPALTTRLFRLDGAANPQLPEKGVGRRQDAEELCGGRAPQRQGTPRAREVVVADGSAAVRTALGIGVAGHDLINPHPGAFRARSEDSTRLSTST